MLRPYDMARLKALLLESHPKGITVTQVRGFVLTGPRTPAAEVREYLDGLAASGLAVVGEHRRRLGTGSYFPPVRSYTASEALLAGHAPGRPAAPPRSPARKEGAR